MVPPEQRLVTLKSMLELIEDKRYFLLHAPRQTGKTTQMISLAKRIHAMGDYIINRPKALERGKDQLVLYLNQLSLESGFLLLFTKGAQEESDELGRQEVLEHQGKTLRIFHF